MDGWAGISALLKEDRSETSALTEDSLDDCAEKAHNKNGDFNRFGVDLGAKDKELYAYLFRRLNEKIEGDSCRHQKRLRSLQADCP